MIVELYFLSTLLRRDILWEVRKDNTWLKMGSGWDFKGKAVALEDMVCLRILDERCIES